MIMKITTKNKRIMSKYINNTIYIAIVTAVLWLAISNAIQAFKCPRMSQTELLIHIPKSFVCDWNQCN